MKKLLVIAFAVAVLAAACSKQGSEQKAAAGSALAKVGNSTVTAADYEREFNALPDYARQMFAGEEGKERFLDEVVKKEMLYQEALKKGMDKSPEFSRKMEDFKKVTLISELLEKEIMSKGKATDQEAREYYDKNKEDFTTTSQIKASHILVKTEAEAQKILERLKQGGKFEEIAAKESLDKPSAQNGGDLGFFSKGQMVPEFERAAAALKVGDVSNPVKTQYGYHIIKVTALKKGPVIEFDKVKDLISQKLSGERQKEAFDSYLAELKKNYKVDVNKEALQKVSLGQETMPAEPEQK